MATEARRGVARILANYIRLGGWLVLGVVLLPYLIRWVGLDGYGLISLLGATLGFAGIFQQLMNQSLIRELGAAYHEGSEPFRRAYNASFVVSATMASLAALVFVGLVLLVHLLNIPEHLVGPARWFVGAQGVYSVLLVLLSPTFAMYRVLERFGWYAFWMIMIRGTALASALVLSIGFAITDIATAVRAHGILWSGLLCAVLLCAVAVLMITDRNLRPAPHGIRRDDVRAVLHTFGWNSAVHIAVNLHERLAALLMNLGFGLFGNAVFNVALQLVSYVRMLTTGVTFGLDAASARISSADPDEALRSFMRNSTRLQAFIALPAGLAMFLLAEPVLQLWIGSSLEDPDAMIPAAVVIIRILTFGLAARAIADGWMFILYGAGHVRRYAPMLIGAGVVSPILGALLMVTLPDPFDFGGPAAAMSGVVLVAHFLVLPAIGVRCTGMRLRDLFSPLIRPALTTIICSPLLLAPAMKIQTWNLLVLIGTCAAFGAAYSVLGWFLVLTTQERGRFTNAIRRRLPGNRLIAPPDSASDGRSK